MELLGLGLFSYLFLEVFPIVAPENTHALSIDARCIAEPAMEAANVIIAWSGTDCSQRIAFQLEPVRARATATRHLLRQVPIVEDCARSLINVLGDMSSGPSRVGTRFLKRTLKCRPAELVEALHLRDELTNGGKLCVTGGWAPELHQTLGLTKLLQTWLVVYGHDAPKKLHVLLTACFLSRNMPRKVPRYRISGACAALSSPTSHAEVRECQNAVLAEMARNIVSDLSQACLYS